MSSVVKEFTKAYVTKDVYRKTSLAIERFLLTHQRINGVSRLEFLANLNLKKNNVAK